MTGSTWAAVDTSNEALIRKGLRGGVLIAASTATIPASITIDNSGTPVLNVLTGYSNFGKISDNGAVVSSDISSSDLKAWGSLTAVRRDITGDTTSVKFSALETNKNTVETYFGVSGTSATALTKEVDVIKPIGPTVTYYRMLVIALDGDDVNFSYVAYDLPRVSLTDRGDQTFASGDDPIAWDMTFTAYKDATAGYAARFMAGGTQWKSLITAMGWS